MWPKYLIYNSQLYTKAFSGSVAQIRESLANERPNNLGILVYSQSVGEFALYYRLDSVGQLPSDDIFISQHVDGYEEKW